MFGLSLYYTYLLIVWGVFRLFFKFPELIDELWFKPVLWLLPLYWVWQKEGRKIKFFSGNPLRAIAWGAGVGGLYVLMVLIINVGRFGSESLTKIPLNVGEILGLGLVTAVVEELVFSGFVFQKVLKMVKNLGVSMAVSASMFSLIHVPIGLFVYKYSLGQMVGFLMVVGLLSAANAYLMGRTKNVLAPIVSHFMWLAVAGLLSR